MKIFVMRHGEAEMLAKSDKARELTEKGRQQSLQQGQWLKDNFPTLDYVIVSPYSRALQTLEQIDKIYEGQLANKTEIRDGITPYGDAEIISDYLLALYEQHSIESLLIISHLPLVGEIVTELCQKNPINYQTSTIAQIEWDTEIGIIEQIKYADK